MEGNVMDGVELGETTDESIGDTSDFGPPGTQAGTIWEACCRAGA
jgi:hypothetical protein